MTSLFFALGGCVSMTSQPQVKSDEVKNNNAKNDTVGMNTWPCVGEIGAPPMFAGKLTKVEFPDSFKPAIGKPGEGGLCKAEAYKVTDSFEIFRGWNATYEGGKLGKWWAFTVPSKSIATYRKNYAVCYTYSALDMLVRCTVREGTILALGTGQSAKCDEYLTYDISPTIQIYLPDASEATLDCKTYQGNFAWESLPEPEPQETQRSEAQEQAL